MIRGPGGVVGFHPPGPFFVHRALANRATEAGNLIAAGDIQGAIDKLDSLLQKIDGEPSPPDWMDDSPEKTALAEDVGLLITLLEIL